MNRLIHRAATLAAAGAVAVSGLSVATAATASADPGAPTVHFTTVTKPAGAKAVEDCPATAVCLFWDAGFTGTYAYGEVTDETFPPGTCFPFDEELAANVSSIVNNAARSLTFFHENECAGDNFVLPSGAELSFVGPVYNDHVAAILF